MEDMVGEWRMSWRICDKVGESEDLRFMRERREFNFK